MNSYHYCGVAFSRGNRVKFFGDDKELHGKTGKITKIVSGGVRVKFGSLVDTGVEVNLHPAKLRKVEA